MNPSEIKVSKPEISDFWKMYFFCINKINFRKHINGSEMDQSGEQKLNWKFSKICDSILLTFEDYSRPHLISINSKTIQVEFLWAGNILWFKKLKTFNFTVNVHGSSKLTSILQNFDFSKFQNYWNAFDETKYCNYLTFPKFGGITNLSHICSREWVFSIVYRSRVKVVAPPPLL